MMNTQWHVATILAGCGIAGLGTGDRVVFRLCGGQVHVLAHGGASAVLPLRTAKRCLECQRTPDLRPVLAVGQTRLDIRWCRTREARRFDGMDRRAA